MTCLRKKMHIIKLQGHKKAAWKIIKGEKSFIIWGDILLRVDDPILQETRKKLGVTEEEVLQAISHYLKGESMPKPHNCKLSQMIMNRINVMTNMLLEQASFVGTTTSLSPEHLEYLQDLITDSQAFADCLLGKPEAERNYNSGKSLQARPEDYCCIDKELKLFGHFVFSLTDEFEASHITIKDMAKRVIKKANNFQKELIALKEAEA